MEATGPSGHACGCMKGVWTEVVSNATCPRCAASGKPDSRLYHYVTEEGDLSIFQTRCHVCKAVSTRVNDSSPRALALARKAQRSGRTLVFGVILGNLFAIAAMAATASALAAMR